MSLKISGADHPLAAVNHVQSSLENLALPDDFDVEKFILEKDYEMAKKLRARMTVEHFAGARNDCKVAPVGWRLFHKCSRMPKDLRRILQYDGEQSVELDIKNCQPLLLAIYLRDHAGELKVTPGDVDKLIEVTTTGKFYEHLGAGMKIDREKLKKRVCRDLLFGWRHFHCTEIFEVFEDLFPSAARALA
ncbi:MAG: hypothetical protein NTV46_02875, partial [Verrucomicrobia bacterium]|nr:hypothetical protein [Verrucomicrobiota bacterium]